MDLGILSGIEESDRVLVLEMPVSVSRRGRGRLGRGGLRWGIGVELSPMESLR